MASNDFQAPDEPSLARFSTSSHVPPVRLQSNTSSLESCFMFASHRASLEESEPARGSFPSVPVERLNNKAHPPPPPYTPANHELRVPAALPKRIESKMRNPLQRWATNRRSSGNNSSTSANSSAAASNPTTSPPSTPPTRAPTTPLAVSPTPEPEVPVWTPKLVLTAGDVPLVRKDGHKVSPLEVRELSELIRTRYMLDIKIWNKRDCHTEDRPLVEGFMRRADAALLRIRSTVEAWDNADAWEYPADWQRLKDIKAKLAADGKRMWAEHPPWEDQPQESFGLIELP